MRRSQPARLASDDHQMSASINVAGPVEIVRDGDLLAASLAQRHSSSVVPKPGSFMANVPSYRFESGKTPMSPTYHPTDDPHGTLSDRYPLSPRIRVLRGILAKFGPMGSAACVQRYSIAQTIILGEWAAPA
jgi:hypothetical protein